MKRRLTLSAVALVVIAAVAMTAMSVMASGESKLKIVRATVPTRTELVGGHGWQAPFSYSVPPGIGGLFFHYPCPGTLIANSGEFAVDFADPSAATVKLIGQGVRTDVPGLHEYFWNITWGGAAAPAGSHIAFNVHCLQRKIG
jgi:hypothetical protein